MDVRAIVLLCPPDGQQNSFSVCLETIAGVPISTLDVLGKPVYKRVVERLHRFGVNDVTVVCAAPAPEAFPKSSACKTVEASPEQFWRSVETAFSDYAQAGADAVLAVRVGPYAEVNYDELLQFHHDQRNRVTSVAGPDGLSLDTFVLSASRRNDAAFLLRHQLKEQRVTSPPYICRGYINRLCDAIDLRRLAVDAFLGSAGIAPAGREIRPGIWVADGARIQRGARLLAPAFIGHRAKVRPATVITRFSALEHHSEVDCGTVVENSTVLPYTYVGAGLDASHAVLGMKRVIHLQRQVEVEISDPKLVDMIASSPARRTLSSAVSLTSFLPLQLVRGLFSRSSRGEPTPALPESLNPCTAELQPDMQPGDTEFTTDLAVARRYGDQ